MTYEVVICDEKSSSNGKIIHCGTLEDCCKYASITSQSSCLNLMVRPKIPTYLFVNGQKSDVQ